MESLSDDIAESLPKVILERLDRLYPKLAPTGDESFDGLQVKFGEPAFELPTIEVLGSRLSECSFMHFSDPVAYAESARAKTYLNWSAPKTNLYRVYFNAFSKKIYVDLNAAFGEVARSAYDAEKLYCEILRTLIYVLTCEVDARGAHETVSGDVTEVVLTEG